MLTLPSCRSSFPCSSILAPLPLLLMLGFPAVSEQKTYESCFREWYTDKFLKGDSSPACAEHWEVRSRDSQREREREREREIE